MMDSIAQKQIVTQVLRTAGVIAVFVGCILVTQAIVAAIAAQSASSNLIPGIDIRVKGGIGSVMLWGIVGQLAVVAWGVGLFAIAEQLAAWITAE